MLRCRWCASLSVARCFASRFSHFHNAMSGPPSSALARRVFSAFKDKKMLARIADQANVTLSPERDVITQLSEHLYQLGLIKSFNVLPKPLILSLISTTPSLAAQFPAMPTVAVAASAIVAELNKQGAKNFFETVQPELLGKFLDYWDYEIKPANEQPLSEQVIDACEYAGMQHLLTGFDPIILDELLTACGLKCTSRSLPIMIECLIDQESYEQERVETEQDMPQPSKPEINEQISKVDLYHWFGMEELRDYLNSQGLSGSGSKKDMITRILNSQGRTASGKPLTGKKRERTIALTKPKRPVKRAKKSESGDSSKSPEVSNKALKLEKKQEAKKEGGHNGEERKTVDKGDAMDIDEAPALRAIEPDLARNEPTVSSPTVEPTAPTAAPTFVLLPSILPPSSFTEATTTEPGEK